MIDKYIDTKVELEILKKQNEQYNKIIMYCIGKIHNVGVLKYIGAMCRKAEKFDTRHEGKR